MVNSEQSKAAARAKIVARAWRDPAFKAKLLADPHRTLAEAGVDLPDGMTIKVVENTDTQFHFVLPPKPVNELSDASLDKAVGASSCTNFCFKDWHDF